VKRYVSLDLFIHRILESCLTTESNNYLPLVISFDIPSNLFNQISTLRNKDIEMLVLTRRVGENMLVGDDVTITILGVKGNQIRIGIVAPKNVAVHREEVWKKVQQQKNRFFPRSILRRSI